MNIAIFNVSKIRREQKRLYFSDTFLLFALQIAKHFDNTGFFCVPFSSQKGMSDDIKYHSIPQVPHNIDIIECRPYGSLFDFFKKLPVSLLMDFNKYRRTVKKADAVMLRLPAPSCTIAFPMARLYGKAIVTYYASDIRTVVMSGSKYEGVMKPIARTAARMVFRLYKYFVDNSDSAIFLSRELMDMHNQPRSHYAFPSLVREEDVVFRKGAIGGKAETGLVYAGRLSHEKGIEYLVKAVSLLKREGVNVRLTLCGTGPWRDRLESLAAETGTEDRVEFPGYIEDHESLGKIFLENDIFVLPSLSETTGKVMLEAMAKGMAIVATNIGGIPDVVTHGENGLLVREKSEEELARAIRSVIEDHELHRKLVHNGYEFAEKHTDKSQAEKIARIIKETIKEKKGG